jgi:hypothetical protein
MIHLAVLKQRGLAAALRGSPPVRRSRSISPDD